MNVSSVEFKKTNRNENKNKTKQNQLHTHMRIVAPATPVPERRKAMREPSSNMMRMP